MDIKKEKEFLCGFKIREEWKGKKIKYQVLGSWTVHCRDKGDETVEGSSAVALILPPLSLSFLPVRGLSSLSCYSCYWLFCEEVGNTCISYTVFFVYFLNWGGNRLDGNKPILCLVEFFYFIPISIPNPNTIEQFSYMRWTFFWV